MSDCSEINKGFNPVGFLVSKESFGAIRFSIFSVSEIAVLKLEISYKKFLILKNPSNLRGLKKYVSQVTITSWVFVSESGSFRPVMVIDSVL